MVTSRRLDPEALHKQLSRALRHSARASRLVRHTPELVELLSLRSVEPETPLNDRAIKTEAARRQAVEQIGGTVGDALSILLCLCRAPWAPPLKYGDAKLVRC